MWSDVSLGLLAATTWQSVVDGLAFDPARALASDMLVRYAVQVLLLCGSAFFSGSETALFSLSSVDLRQLRQARHPHAGRLQALLDEPRRLIVSILCGNELVNVAAVANMTGILVALYGEARAGWLAVLVMLPLLLLLGEVTPKTIAVTSPRRVAAGLVAGPLSLWVRVVAPLRWLVRHAADRITTLIVGPQRASEHLLQVDELRSVIEDVADSGQLTATGRTLINNLLSAGSTEIVEILTPRSQTVFVDADLPLPEALARFREARHSRVPVYRGHRDNLIGFLHAEDLLPLRLDLPDPSGVTLEDLLRPPVVVPLTKTVNEMFEFFTRNRARAAAALNEYGGVVGFVTINDVLRAIFGSLIRRGERETRIRAVAPGTYEMPGDTRLGELNRVTNLGLQDPRMTTIGGVAFRLLDRLPQVGDEVTRDGVTLTALAMDAHRIAQVRVSRVEAPPTAPEAEAPVTSEAPEAGDP